MTSLFDGMGEILTDVLGAAVTVTPAGGQSRTIQAAFREGPRLIPGPDGVEVTTVLPTLKGKKSDLEDLIDGGEVNPGSGHLYRAGGWMPSGSPAQDGLAELELTRIGYHA